MEVRPVNSTVLIVDEDVNARIIAETLLRVRGLEVRCADDTAGVYQIVEHEDVAVVVLDLSLSGNVGLEVFRRLRSRSGVPRWSREPRVVVVSSRQEPEVELFARRLGADAFLRKPLEPGEFISTVEHLALGAPLRSAGAARRR